MENILNIIITCLVIGVLVLSLYFMFIYGYNLIVSLFGYKNLKKDYELINNQTKFLILVAAHNEEKVISSTIENLKQIKYNRDLFDICIVSDNSTDRTTEIAREHGVMVVDTIQGKFVREGVGKPAGMQYALRELGFENIKINYDLVMVLDADNFVDSNILQEVNSQYIAKDKPEAIQTYLDSKNYGKLMSLAYSVVFWTNNRFMQAAKYRIGLANSIGGTGFFVKTEWLINNGGFNFKSLTEDLEMEIDIVKNGGRVLWNNFTGIYDEKPENTKISMVQRHRWIKGHWYVAFKEVLGLTKKFVTTGKLKYLDKIIFLMSMGKAMHMFLILLLLAANGVLAFEHDELTKLFMTLNLIVVWQFVNEYFLYVSGANIFLLLYSFGVLPLYSTIRRIGKNNPAKVIVALQWFMLTDFIVQFIGLFTWHRQGVWVATPHDKVAIETQEESYARPAIYNEELVENNEEMMKEVVEKVLDNKQNNI